MRTHIIVPDELIKEVDKVVGPRRRSSFITEAIERELKHERLMKSARKVAGSLKDVDIPGWETRESAAKWVHDSRHADDEKLRKKWKK